MISFEKSDSTSQFPVNKVIKFGPCWPRIEYKNTGSYSRGSLPISLSPLPLPFSSSPFPFSSPPPFPLHFSPPLPFPPPPSLFPFLFPSPSPPSLFAPATQAKFNKSPKMCQLLNLRYATPLSLQIIVECEQFFITVVYGPRFGIFVVIVTVIQRSAYVSHSMLLALDPSQGTSPGPQAWHLSEEAVLKNIPLRQIQLL